MNETIAICIAVAAFVGVIILLMWVKARKVPPNFREVSDSTHKIDKLNHQAAKLVAGFQQYIGNLSPLNRKGRRRVKRHYKKFLIKWHELPTKYRDVGEIALYLSRANPHNHAVRSYLAFQGDVTREIKAEDKRHQDRENKKQNDKSSW